MSKWTETPFETLEGAHHTALRFKLNPSAIIDTGQGFRSFQCKEGRAVTIVAQKIEGGPVLEKRLPKGKRSSVPLQDPNAPSFGEEDRLLAGPWTDSDHATLEEVRAHYSALGPSTKHRITFEGEALEVSYPDKDIVEYRRAYAGVQQRSLFSAKNRYLKPYNKSEFLAGPWSLSEHQDVEAHWREQYVNFDNVEVLQVTLYRIGQDEYEYTEDVNTGEVWCRVLGEVK